jgi:hypothetical protein
MEKHIFVRRVTNLSSLIDVRVLNRNKVIIHPFIHEYVCMYVCMYVFLGRRKYGYGQRMRTGSKLSSRNEAVVVIARCSGSSHAEFVLGGGRSVFALSFFKFLCLWSSFLSVTATILVQILVVFQRICLKKPYYLPMLEFCFVLKPRVEDSFARSVCNTVGLRKVRSFDSIIIRTTTEEASFAHLRTYSLWMLGLGLVFNGGFFVEENGFGMSILIGILCDQKNRWWKSQK